MVEAKSASDEQTNPRVIAQASALINTRMSMRRHIMIAEHFRLMSLLLESREQAIYSRFVPLIAQQRVPNLSHNDITALVPHCTNTVQIGGPQGLQSVQVKGLLAWTPSQVAGVSEDTQAIRANAIAEAIVRMVWAADPNPKKAYTTWMLTRFLNAKRPEDRLALEDLDRTAGYLSIYDRVKAQLPPDQRDINRFRSTNDLFDAIRDFREDESGQVVSQGYEQQMYAQAEIIYQGPDYEILSPKTKDAACYFGRGTEWCTAYVPPKTNNQFEYYNSKAPLYIVRDKSTGQRWQFWKGNSGWGGQFMDEGDRRIDTADFTRSHPKVIQVFDEYFGVQEPQIIGKTHRAVIYLTLNKNGAKTVTFEKEGWSPGGIFSGTPRFTLTTDANGVIVSSTGELEAGEEEQFVEAMNQRGIRGNCQAVNSNGLYWSEEKGWGDVDVLPVVLEQHDMLARHCDFNNGSGKITCEYGVGDPNGSDDLATIHYGHGEFTLKKHLSRWSSFDDDQLLFLADVVLLDQIISPDLKFNREQSDERLPNVPVLLEKRPQWVDLRYLWDNTGMTDLFRERFKAWVPTKTELSKADWVGPDKIVVMRYGSLSDVIDASGDNTSKYAMKLANGDRSIDSWDAGSPDSYARDRMLTALFKDKELWGKVVAYMKEHYESDMEDCGLEDIEDTNDLEVLIDEAGMDEFNDAFDVAYATGCEVGVEGEYISNFKSAVESCSHLWFETKDESGKIAYSAEFEWDATPVVVASVDEIFQFCNEPNDVEDDSEISVDKSWLHMLDDEITMRDRDYYGYDDDAANERFLEDVAEVVD